MWELRTLIENVVKNNDIDRLGFFEVSKFDYMSIIKKIEDTYVDKSVRWDKDIHWSNMGNYKKQLNVTYVEEKNRQLVNHLVDIVPKEDEFIWFLVEDTNKYFLYEGRTREIVFVLNETPLYDFYLVSKKLEWLISENHHNCWSFIGDNLDLSPLIFN